MTGRLKKAFKEASKLSEEEQDELARFVLASERRWSGTFRRSGDRLRELADEAIGEHDWGATTALDPDAL